MAEVGGVLGDILARLNAMPPQEKAELAKLAFEASKGLAWIPNPGPQSDAYYSPADLLLYGGSGGAGKSGLLLGLALTAHRRSLIMRRRYTDLGAMTEEAIKFNGTRDGFNGSAPPKLRTRDGRLIDFGAANIVGDEQSWQGQAHDLLGVDEATQLAESQIRFLMGWVRTTEEGQRCRTVLATNPPLSAIGQWVIGMFRPWLDLTHPNPAKPGELRWYVTDPDGKDLEVSGPQPVEIDGRMLEPKSRTFIPGNVKDNPYLVRTGYPATLDALPEPLRSAVRDGNFMAARADAERQVIPAAWVRAAQQRWRPRPPEGVPMTVIAADVAQGGPDNTVLAPCHDTWFASLIVTPGKDTPSPSVVAALIVQHRRDGADVVVDVGGGYGGGVVERLTENRIDNVRKFNGAHASTARTKDRSLGFINKRAESLWRFREALDPDQPGGSPIALPDDPVLTADLTAPTFDITARGIQVESKDDIKARIGRSPDRGDAVVMAYALRQSAFQRSLSVGSGNHATGGRSGPQQYATTGYANMKRRR